MIDQITARDLKLSLVVPVYNEVKAISQTIQTIEQTLSAWSESYEILVVDDGSDDGTLDKLKEFQEAQTIQLITHRKNRGYGAALKTGIRSARGRWVAIVDGDLTYPVDRLRDLYEKVQEGFLMVVGARTGESVKIPWLRRLPKWLLQRLASYLAEFPIPDLNSGFRIFDRRALIPHLALLPDGFSFTTTITLVYLTRNDDVAYIPINYHGRVGTSKIRPIRDTLLFIQLIIRTVTLFRPLKVYLPIALVCEVLALLIIGIHWHMNLRIPDATVAIFAVTGVMLFCLGLLADLVSRRLEHLHELLISPQS